MIKVIVISDNKRQCYDISDLIIVPNTGLWDIRMKDSFMFYFALDTLTIAIKITLTELKNKNRI